MTLPMAFGPRSSVAGPVQPEMEHANAIEVLSFDFDFASQDAALTHHEYLADHAKIRGTEIVDQVLDEFGGEDIISIERLDLELGTIAIDGGDFEDRLRVQLRGALRDAIAFASPPVLQGGPRERLASEATPTRLAIRTAALDGVWHLLATGHLPWRYRETDAATVDALVDGVLAHDGEALAIRLRASAIRSRILARIARQWTPAQRIRLAGLAGYADSEGIGLATAGAGGLANAEEAGRRAGDDRSEPSADLKTASRTGIDTGIEDASLVERVLFEDGVLLAALLRAVSAMPAIMGTIARDWNDGQRASLIGLLASVPMAVALPTNLALSQLSGAESADVEAARRAVADAILRRPALIALLRRLAPTILATLALEAGDGQSGAFADLGDSGFTAFRPETTGKHSSSAPVPSADETGDAPYGALATRTNQRDPGNTSQGPALAVRPGPPGQRGGDPPGGGVARSASADETRTHLLPERRTRTKRATPPPRPTAIAIDRLGEGVQNEEPTLATGTPRGARHHAASFDASYSGDRLEWTLRLIAASRRPPAADKGDAWQTEWESGHPGPVAIEALHQVGGSAARALLRKLAATSGWTATVSKDPAPALWRAVLAAWGGNDADCDMFFALVATLAALASGEGEPTADAAALLHADLLTILLVDHAPAFERRTTLAALVAREAERRGISAARLARAVIAAGPGAMRALIAEDLADATGTIASARTTFTVHASDGDLERRMETALAAARWSNAMWSDLSSHAPEWLAERLRHFATNARWRNAFAAVLDANRARSLLALWLPLPAAGPVARLLSRPDAWQTDGVAAPPQWRFYAWLLAALRFPADQAVEPAELVEAIVLARAQADDLDPLAVSAAVLTGLAGDDSAAALHRQLVARWANPMVRPKHGADATAGLGSLGSAALAWSLAPDRVGSAAVELMGEEARRHLFENLAPGRAALVLGLIDRLSAAWLGLGQDDVKPRSDLALFRAALFDREALLDSASFASAWAAPRLALLAANAREPAGRFLAAVAASPQVGGIGVAAAIAGRASVESPPVPAGETAPAEGFLPRPGVEATPSHQTRKPERTRQFSGDVPVGQGDQSEAHALPKGPFQPDWFFALPKALPAGLRRQINTSLVPAREGMVRLSGLPDPSQRQLLTRLDPDSGPALMLVDALDAHWRTVGLPFDTATDAARSRRLVLRLLFEQQRRFDFFVLAEAWLESRLAAAPAGADSVGLEALAIPSAILPLGAPEALARVALLRALRRAGIATSGTLAVAASPAMPAKTRGEVSPGDDLQTELFHVGNAGLVLIGPYIAPLFTRLGLTVDGRFIDEAAADRAVHLLETAIDGVGEALEPQLILNKLICGIDLHVPVVREFTATPEECEVIQGLLEALIQNWGKLGNTSVAGLREAFLQRPGSLAREEEAWRLTVEARSYDVLVDAIPWGFRTLKLPWMDTVLHVEWR